MVLRFIAVLCFISLLSACSFFSMEPDVPYVETSKRQIDYWSLDGRLAVTGKKDSWQANISWQHSPSEDNLKLSGPLGQGATVIQFTDDTVSIDRGDGNVQSSTEPERFINQQLGVFVPVKSLRYWVVGLSDPTQAVTKIDGGFTQAGWLVEYKQMQSIENDAMPRKITVMNEQVKLKLIVDQWDLHEK